MGSEIRDRVRNVPAEEAPNDLPNDDVGGTANTAAMHVGSGNSASRNTQHTSKQLFVKGSKHRRHVHMIAPVRFVQSLESFTGPDLLHPDDIEEVQRIITSTMCAGKEAERYSDMTEDEITDWMFACAKKPKTEVTFDDKYKFFGHLYYGRMNINQMEDDETSITLLHCTIRMRKTVESLLLLGLQPLLTAIDRYDNMPLHLACAQGSLGMVVYLCWLHYGNRRVISNINEGGRTPAHFAAMYGHLHVLNKLLRWNDAVLDTEDGSEFTAAWWTINNMTFDRYAECIELIFDKYYKGEANSARRAALTQLTDGNGAPFLSDILAECRLPMLDYLIELGAPPSRSILTAAVAKTNTKQGRSKVKKPEEVDKKDASTCVITIAFLWAEEVRFTYFLKRFGDKLLIEHNFVKHIAADDDVVQLCKPSTQKRVPKLMQKVMLRVLELNKVRSKAGGRRAAAEKVRKILQESTATGDATFVWETAFDELKQLDLADGNERGFVLIDFLSDGETKRRTYEKLSLDIVKPKTVKIEDEDSDDLSSEEGINDISDEPFVPGSKSFGHTLASVGKRAANRGRTNAKVIVSKLRNSFTYITEVRLSDDLTSLCEEHVDRLPLSVRDERVSQFACDCMHATANDDSIPDTSHCAGSYCKCNKSFQYKFNLDRRSVAPLLRPLTTLLACDTIADDDFCSTAAAVPLTMHAHAFIIPCSSQCLCEVSMCPLSLILQRPAVYLTVAKNRSSDAEQWNLYTRERIYAGQYVGMIVGDVCLSDELLERQRNVRSSRSSRRSASVARGDGCLSASSTTSSIADSAMPDHVMPMPIPVEFADKLRALCKQAESDDADNAENARKLLKHFDIFIDQRDAANYTRFIRNEPDSPNLTYHLALSRGEERVCKRWLVLFARRQIEADEELTFDYGLLQRHSFAALTKTFSSDDSSTAVAAPATLRSEPSIKTSPLSTKLLTDRVPAVDIAGHGVSTRSNRKRRLESPCDAD